MIVSVVEGSLDVVVLTANVGEAAAYVMGR